MMMSGAEDQDIVLEQVANKDNRILDYQFFVPGGGPHPLSRKDMASRRRSGVSAAVLGTRVHVRPARPSDFAVHDRLRRHRHREPLSEQYRHVPQGAGAGCRTSATCMPMAASAIRSTASSAARRAQSSMPRSARRMRSNGRPPAVRGSFRSTPLWNNGLKVTAVGGEDSISNLHNSKLVGSHRTYVFTGGRGLDMHAWLEGMRAGRAFVTNGPLVELSVNGALPGETVTLPAGGGNVRRAGSRTIDCPAAESDALLQRSGGRRHPVECRSPKRRLQQDAAGCQERVVSRSCGRRSRRSVSARHRLSAGIHQSRLGDRRATSRSATARRPSTRSGGSTSFRSSLRRGRGGARRKRKITCTHSSTRRERCTGGWRPKRIPVARRKSEVVSRKSSLVARLSRGHVNECDT